MAETIYECAIEGSTPTQEIVNILYYTVVGSSPGDWSSTDAQGLGEAVRDAWINNALPLLPDQYTFESVVVRAYNSDRTVASPFAVEVAGSGTGAITTDSETPAMVAICSFQTVPIAQSQTQVIPRRSYIAFGPLTQGSVDEAGAMSYPQNWLDNLPPLLTQGHLVNSKTFTPVRLGTKLTDNYASLGEVVGVILRPFASFRRSRLTPPAGS